MFLDSLSITMASWRKVLVLFLLVVSCLAARQGKFIHPVEQDEYHVLVKLAQGEFSVPVKERTRAEKSAIIKFWRARGKFTCEDDGTLLFNGRKVKKYDLFAYP